MQLVYMKAIIILLQAVSSSTAPEELPLSSCLQIIHDCEEFVKQVRCGAIL
jgi:hypothetical protein